MALAFASKEYFVSYHFMFALVGVPMTLLSLWSRTEAAHVPVLLAQSGIGEMTIAELIKGCADLGSTFLLGWYLYYTAGKAIPKKDELHAATLDKMQEKHIAACKAQQDAYNYSSELARKDFLQALADMRQDYREDVKQLSSDLRDMAGAITKSCSFKPDSPLALAAMEAQRTLDQKHA